MSAAATPAFQGPDSAFDREAVLLATHAHMSSTSLAYHQIVISLNVMVSTITIFSTGYLLTAAATMAVLGHALLAIVPLLLSTIAIIVTLIVRRHFGELAAVIRRIDEALRLFDPDVYIAGASVYPAVWRSFGTKQWREIIFDVFPPLQAFVGLVCAALIVLR